MILVVDDFVKNPVDVRNSALAAGFGTWRPTKGEVGSSVYDGMGFWGDHAQMMFALTVAVRETIIPNSMFFRVTNESTEGAYVHSDREAGQFTCVAYLSEHGNERTGTGFYRHRRTGATQMPSFDELRSDPEEFDRLKTEMVRGSEDDWDMTEFVHGKFNRAVIFDAPLFHARTPKHGFAATAEEGRMVWVCHFMTLSGMRNG